MSPETNARHVLIGFRRSDLRAQPVVSGPEYPRVVPRHSPDPPVARMPDEAEPMPCNGHPMSDRFGLPHRRRSRKQSNTPLESMVHAPDHACLSQKNKCEALVWKTGRKLRDKLGVDKLMTGWISPQGVTQRADDARSSYRALPAHSVPIRRGRYGAGILISLEDEAGSYRRRIPCNPRASRRSLISSLTSYQTMRPGTMCSTGWLCADPSRSAYVRARRAMSSIPGQCEPSSVCLNEAAMDTDLAR
jgi:hypothetical protein